jgi:hypothetical protein
MLVTAITLAIIAAFTQETWSAIALRCRQAAPFRLGLAPSERSLVDQLTSATGTEARILWEDRLLPRQAPRWTALLPHLTGRWFIGGLDPDGFIEHAHVGLLDQNLLGRPLSTWSDAALEDYCRRYNVGWVVCWTPQAAERFRAWKAAKLESEVSDGHAQGQLFAVERTAPSYILKGQAELIHADSHHITLREVVPDNGVVVLSMHHQTGLRAWPSRVLVERHADGELIGFIRLRVAGPVARIILSWDPP